jgi:cbb3-type cytochrome oxidase subunit 3
MMKTIALWAGIWFGVLCVIAACWSLYRRDYRDGD